MDGACRARERAPGRYQPRRPRQSVLYRCVREHLETWLAQCRDGHYDAGPVPAYVEREFRRYRNTRCRAITASRRLPITPASRRPAQIKPCYAAPDGASRRWIYYPSPR
jgi:hypothetical protein